jgi:hypothetical protein
VYGTLSIACLSMGEPQDLKLDQHTWICRASTHPKAKINQKAGAIGCRITYFGRAVVENRKVGGVPAAENGPEIMLLQGDKCMKEKL